MAKINTVLLVPQQLGDFLSNLKGKSLQHATPAAQVDCVASEKTTTIDRADTPEVLRLRKHQAVKRTLQSALNLVAELIQDDLLAIDGLKKQN